MTTDEILLRDATAVIKQLRARIDILEQGSHPKGAALKVFNAFWKTHKSLGLPQKELTSLAFDAGHKLHHDEIKGK